MIVFELRVEHKFWRRSADAVGRLPFTPAVAGIEVLDKIASQVVDEIKARPTYRQHYESIADYQFAMVPVNSLLAPQSLADMDYVDELSRRISADASIEEQLLFAMAEGVIAEPIVAGPQVVFTSQGRDLHAEPIPSIRTAGTGEYEIVVRASSRPNYIQVTAIGNRLLLTNGVHKVCALLLKGYTHVPCVLRRISRIEESGVNLQTSLFRPELFNGTRPAQVVDFLNEDVAVSVLMRSMHQVLTVAIGIGMLQVPAVSQFPPVTPVVGDRSRATVLVVPKNGEIRTETDAGSRRAG